MGAIIAYGQYSVILPLVFPPVMDYLFPFLSTSRAVDDHYQLVPYFLTIGADALKKGTSAMIPLAKHESFIDKVYTINADVHGYLLCATFVCGGCGGVHVCAYGYCIVHTSVCGCGGVHVCVLYPTSMYVYCILSI